MHVSSSSRALIVRSCCDHSQETAAYSAPMVIGAARRDSNNNGHREGRAEIQVLARSAWASSAIVHLYVSR